MLIFFLQVFDKILDSDCEEAKTLLRRIQKREFYKSIAEIRPLKGSCLHVHIILKCPYKSIRNYQKNYFIFVLGDLLFNAKAKDIENDIRQLIPEAGTMQNDNNSLLLRREEIVVIVRRVTMGMGSRNPIERVIII